MRQQKKWRTTAKNNIQQFKRLDGRTGKNFRKYLGATGVRYIRMCQASHVQENKEWNLEKQ